MVAARRLELLVIDGYPNGVFKGLVFYGLGGSEEDMQDQVTSMQGRIRPQGYDCNGIV